LHVDSKMVVTTFEKASDGSPDEWTLVHIIKKLLGLDLEVIISHSYHEANNVVYVLATWYMRIVVRR
jgi:hypothetical protein